MESLRECSIESSGSINHRASYRQGVCNKLGIVIAVAMSIEKSFIFSSSDNSQSRMKYYLCSLSYFITSVFCYAMRYNILIIMHHLSTEYTNNSVNLINLHFLQRSVSL